MSSLEDQVDATTELFLSASLAKRHNVLTHCGICYNCDEVISEGVYCDEDCKNDHEKREKLTPQQG